ncbi:hypothetical protein [Bacillus cereus]|uniref:hypothetical protein n=1 Tax=Bacillus cereus TaxID=1396 RepID=UPI000BF5A26B|nr:hypothetical protein [Bacillus cereus]MCC3687413.1 hypothetical protein [Bacillus cereus]PFA76919.1 hypothetical protein CN406_17905 [Bacillus cereus]
MNKLINWLEMGVALGKITGYGFAFKNEATKGLKRYMVVVEHVQVGKVELHVVIQNNTVVIKKQRSFDAHLETIKML